jgi:peptide methionine sulfoxide reductase MsrA
MDTNRNELATFAGGCFWCMVSPFDQMPGIKTTQKNRPSVFVHLNHNGSTF